MGVLGKIKFGFLGILKYSIFLAIAPNFFAQTGLKIESVIRWIDLNERSSPNKVYDTLQFLKQETVHAEIAERYKIMERSAKFALERMRNVELCMQEMTELRKLVYAQSDFRYRMRYHNTLGELYYFEGINREKSFREFKTALAIMEKNKSNFLADLIYSNYAISVIADGNYEKARYFNTKALKISAGKKDYWLHSIIANNLAVNYLYLNKADSAEYYFLYSFDIAKISKDPLDDSQRALYLGLFYNNHGNPEKALHYFKFMEASFSILESNEDKMQMYRGMAMAYELKKDFSMAFENSKKQMIYMDSIAEENLKQDEFIYKSKTEIADLKFKNQLAKIKVARVEWQIISSVLALITLSLVTFFLIIRNRKNRILNQFRADKNLQEKEILNLEKEIAERETATKALILMEKDNVIHAISNKLQDTLPKLDDNNQELVFSMIRELKGSLNNKKWEEFEMTFNKVSPRFFKKLAEDFPNLSTNEKKLCAFLSMHMTSKQISSITGQSASTINISRGRLRKKLNLDHTGIDIHEFLDKYK